MVGSGSSEGSGQSVGRTGRMLHHQPARTASDVASVYCDDLSDRNSAIGRPDENAASDSVARCRYGDALGRVGLSGDGNNFRKISGHKDLWMLKAILRGSKSATRHAVASDLQLSLRHSLSLRKFTPPIMKSGRATRQNVPGVEREHLCRAQASIRTDRY